MARTHGGTWLLAVALLCAAPAVVGSSPAPATFEQKLLEADKLRTSDPPRFAILLDELDAAGAHASKVHRQRLQYLRAYQSIVYRDQREKGNAQAKDLFENAGEIDLRFRAGSLLANSLAITRDFTGGLRYLGQTLPMRDRVRDKDIRHDGIDSAAAFYNQMGQYKLGLQYAQETLADNPNPRARCAAGYFQLESQYHLGLLPADDASIHEGITQCLAIGEKMPANFIRLVLASKWVAQGEVDRAIELLEQHVVEVEGVGYHWQIGKFRSLLAELTLAKGQVSAARLHAQAAIAQVEHLASSKLLATSYNVLYQIAEREGQPVAALAFYRQYAEAERAHLADVKARDLAYEVVREEAMQKAEELKQLHGENELLLLQQRVDQQANQNTRLWMLLMALLVALVGHWAYKLKLTQQSLRRFAETDALTGISNRHHFTQQAEKALAQSAATGEPCALVMFDLDHFKLINDSYGHDIGDWVLKDVARTCESLCRGIDHLGRLGGEEFAILLRGIDLQAATRLAEDCRVRLTQIDTRECGHSFVVTASFGVSATPLSGYTLAKLLTHADQMLYSGKRSGRNRVHAYTGELFLYPPQLHVVSRSDGLPPKHGAELSSADVPETQRS